MEIKFYGGAGMVTGSNYLIETNDYKILIDCGMFQGNDLIESKNFKKFPYDPKEIDYLILTHAHIDHSGRIPKLVKDGFKGRIISTNPTYDLSKIMLLDSASIQESDIKWENKKRERAGKNLIKPLYTKEDANKSLNFFEPYFLNQMIKLNDNISLRFRDAGHILGSAIVELWIKEERKETKFVFSGDLGVKGRQIINDPETVEDADYIIVESTYGNRLHNEMKNRKDELISIINKTAMRGGTVLIPSFAVGRTQEIIYELNKYYEYESIEEHMRIPIYVDSPMAVKATRAFIRNSSSFNEETRQLILSGDNPFTFDNLRYIESQEESKLLNRYKFPKVIISSSGMATAGRIRHHLKHNLWKKENSLVFVGYQAEGSLGRILLDGSKKVKLLGEEIDVKLEVYNLEGFSAHADRKGILNWLSGFKNKPKKVFVVHGEEEASKYLSLEIEKELGFKTIVPKLGDSYKLKDSKTQLKDEGDTLYEDLKSDIINQLSEIDEQMSSFLNKESELLNESLLNKEYNNIRNNLIELNHILMDLNIILGK